MMHDEYADYDSPWKEMLERYFQEFMEFFFPQPYNGIDWSYGYRFLDKELQQVVRDAEFGRRLVDKLITVVEKETGKEKWVLVHIEVQGFHEELFDKRMYIYNYRLFDRYDQPVCSLAVLADDREHWRPHEFRYELWGCKVHLEFPIVKLLDYRNRIEELEDHDNPFAFVVLAYLKTRETKKKPQDRFQWKFRLFRLLYEKGYSKEDILELTRFLDWVMTLPEELEKQFDKKVVQFEEERKMQYITSFERHGIEKGMQQGIVQGLQQGLEQGLQKGLQQGRDLGYLESSREDIFEVLGIRFHEIPEYLVSSIHKIDRLALLKQLHRTAVTVETLQAFEKELQENDAL